MKFTWLSNSPWSPSGYGQQTRIAVSRITQPPFNNQIGIICYFGLEGGMIQLMPNVLCLPKRYHPYGNDIAVAHSQGFGAQFMVTLTDAWVLNVEEYPPGFRWVPWYPVDHDPMPLAVRRKLTGAWKRIAMSKFGVAKSHEAGLDCLYVPHAVETGVLQPAEKAQARENLKLPADRWIVGMVAMNKGNPSRKNFVEQITAFAAGQKRHPSWFLYLQTDRGDTPGDWVNLPELCSNLGMLEGRDYAICDPYNNAVGYPPPFFAALYSSFDVLLMVTAGEGFGIPIIEAQACGCPVIAGDWTAMSELVHAGRLVGKEDAEPEYSQFASYRWKPHVGAVTAALEAEYRTSSRTGDMVEWIKANYDADVVVEKHWKPVLAEIERDL